MYSFKQRHAIWQKITSYGVLLPVFIFGVTLIATLFAGGYERASAATNSTLNFQGRLMTAGGSTVPDGSYNLEFKLYSASAVDGGETLVQGACQTNPGPIADEDCLWVESRTGGNTVTVQNGYFSVALGSVNAFPTTINWDQELWLGMNVGGTSGPSWDGEMTPRFKLTAVPYAFRAGALVDASGTEKTADDLAQITPSSVQTANAAVAALRLNQTGTGGLLQLQGNGTDVFTVDKSGNTVLGAGITLSNSSSTVAGTIRWNGSAFQGYNGSAWTSLGSSAVMPFVSKTKLADETQNNGNNATATLQNDDELFFSVGANETWNFRFVIQATTPAAPDIKFTVTAPVGATCNFGAINAEDTVTVGNLGCGVSSGILNTAGVSDVYEIAGSITNGSTAGTLTLQWAQNTANAANTIVRAGSYVEASRSVGGSSADVAFIQNGNSFGGTAVLGTNDANGLSFETNGVERMQILSTGEIRTSGDFIANRTATGTTGTTSGTGTSTTTLTLSADAFAVNDVVLIDNAGQDYYTRITADAGTGSYTVSPAVTFENARTVTKYTIQNVGATASDYTSQANRFFQGYFLGGIVVGAGSTTISDGLIERTTGDITITPGSGGIVQVNGSLDATTITGDGSGLTNIDGSSVDGSTITTLNASNISSGTLADGRLSSNVTLLGNAFNGVSQLVQLDGSGNLPALNGSGLTSLTAANLTGALPAISGASLTSLNATNISSGTLDDARLSTNVTVLGNTFNGNNQLVQLNGSGALPALSGANLTSLTSGNLTGALPAISGASLTSLNGSNISSGTVADARLSTNVTLVGNTFNGINQLVQLNGSGALPALDASNLTSLTSANLSGALPAISGASLTSLNGSNISSGTISNARLSANVTLLGNSFNGASQLVQLNASGELPVISGANLTNISAANLTGALPAISGASLTSLNGSNISSGTVADARLSTNVTLLGNSFNSNNQLVQLNASGELPAISGVNLTSIPSANLSGALPAISGASLTSLNGTNITSGTVADARLSTNVTVAGNTFNGTNQLVQLNGSGALPALNGANLTSLTSANLTGALPAISGASLTSLSSSSLSGALPAISGASLTSLTAANLSGTLPAISGASLTSLNASNIGSGTISDTYLSANVALLSGTQTFSGSKTFSTGVVLGQTTLTSSATVARAVNLPDEAGTICLSNTNTCGYLRLAAGSLQTDASSNDVLAVNKTSATGNLINLQRSGTAVFTVANSGALQIQSTSSTALDIRNVGGTSYFSIDTSSGVVRVGPSVADATGVLFVLDTKNTSGDPTGADGAQYYNSALQQFRCYRDGVWEPCGSNPIDRAWSLEDEFMSGYTGGSCTTTTAVVGNVNWACYTSGTATTAYNVGAILPTADHPGIMRMTTAAANGNGFTIAATGNNSGSVVLAAGQRVLATVGQGATITNNRLRVGLHAETTTNAQPTTGVWWEADSTTNANWRYCFGTGAVATCAASSVAVAASTLYNIDIRITATGAGVSSATFEINGNAYTVTNVTIGTATRVNPAISCFNSTASARECFVDYYRASGTASARR